ncbi:MAG: transposase [Desulfobacteraceae bacterium]|nr:transposase [Desulfobacteraceae bacterium]
MTKAQMINKDNTTNNDKIYIAFELSNKNWKLVFSDGVKRRHITVIARDRESLELQIKKAKQRFDLPEGCPTYSCYEAGRDGFWIHHYLESMGINNFVVAPASIEVSRRYRHVKTDRVDAGHQVRSKSKKRHRNRPVRMNLTVSRLKENLDRANGGKVWQRS